MRKGNLFPEHIEETETMRNLIDFSGKKIIVAGASSGIGRQTAITLSTVGARLILIARRAEKLQETLQLLEGEGHSCYAADLSDLEGIESLFKRISDEQGPADGLVYCAGISASMPVQLLKPEKLMSVFAINCFAFIECVRQVTKKNRYNQGMRIVAVSSTAARIGNKAHTAYSASKAALEAAVRCLSKELADKKVCVCSIAPGMTKTDMYMKFQENAGGVSKTEEDILNRQYLGLGEPEDIANAIAFLLSASARFVTGVSLAVDGGATTT